MAVELLRGMMHAQTGHERGEARQGEALSQTPPRELNQEEEEEEEERSVRIRKHTRTMSLKPL